MSASDGAVALRSLPRRFRESFRPDELDVSAAGSEPRSGSPGSGAAVTLITATTEAFGALARALERAVGIENPELGELLTRSRPVAPAAVTAQVALDQLAKAATAFADRVDQVALRDWDRPATEGGAPIRALDVLKEAVAVGRTNLDALPAALEAARRLG